MGVARAPVAASGAAPAWMASVWKPGRRSVMAEKLLETPSPQWGGAEDGGLHLTALQRGQRPRGRAACNARCARCTVFHAPFGDFRECRRGPDRGPTKWRGRRFAPP